TAPAPQSAPAAGGRQLADEVFDQGRLADPGLAGHAEEQPLTSRGRLEGVTQLRELFLATHGMTVDGGNRWAWRPTGSRSGQLRRQRYWEGGAWPRSCRRCRSR